MNKSATRRRAFIKYLLLFSLILPFFPGCDNDLALTRDLPESGFYLEIVPLTIWGTELSDSRIEIVDLAGNRQVQTNAPLLVSIASRNEYRLRVTATEFVEAQIQIRYDNSNGTHNFSIAETGEIKKQLAVSQDTRKINDGEASVTTVYIGLKHPWFADSGRPARKGNAVDLLMDGQDFWDAVEVDLRLATQRIHLATWYWQSDFEVFRPANHVSLTEAERYQNTIFSILDQKPAVTKRILINQFAPDVSSGISYFNTDQWIRDKARTPSDNFEVILQPNQTQVPFSGDYVETGSPEYSFTERVYSQPEYSSRKFVLSQTSPLTADPIDSFAMATYHQKFIIIDGRIGYVTGMNVKSSDWDTHDHRVFDAFRMKWKTGNAEREKVAQKKQLPDLGPRKDYGVRIVGPIVEDIEDVFLKRWEYGINSRDLYSENSSPFTNSPYNGFLYGSVYAQVVNTLPVPFYEKSIYETLANAISNARNYIYIEDQYFRVPLLNDLLANSLQSNPLLQLIVVTKEVSIADGGKKYTYLADKFFRENFPQQYSLFQLKSFDLVFSIELIENQEQQTFAAYFIPMDTHSKILLIDDIYLCVGSTNKNNRGLLYEGEMNVAIYDAAFVKYAREQIYRNLVGTENEALLNDDPIATVDLFKTLAGQNAAIEKFWTQSLYLSYDEAKANENKRPTGFLYPLTVTAEYLIEIGPDMF